MQSAIISDTSCLILLDKIGALELLHRLFGDILTTPEVAEEFGDVMPEWIKITEPTNKSYQLIVEKSLDKGEASAITLAIELENSLLIIDELKGRNYAQKLGLDIIGTIGVIIQAKLDGYIPSVHPLLEAIRKTNFRISKELEATILEKAGEK